MFSHASAYAGGEPVLEEEYVYIDIRENNIAEIKVVFHFENTSGYAGEMGFPGTYWFNYDNFTAEWNGVDLDIVFKTAPGGYYYEINNDRYSSIYKFKAPLSDKQNSVHIIRYTYTIPYVNFEKDLGMQGYYIEYILRTGSLWKGKVKKLFARVKMHGSMQCSSIMHLPGSYTGRCTSEKVWKFYAEDIELEKDIRLLYNAR